MPQNQKRVPPGGRGGGRRRPSRPTCRTRGRSPCSVAAADSATGRPEGRGRSDTISLMIDSAISCGVRAPMSSPAGEWMRDVWPSADVERRDDGLRPLAGGDEADVGHVGLEGRSEHSLLVASVRGDDERRVGLAGGVDVATVVTVQPSCSPMPDQRDRRPVPSPTTMISGAGDARAPGRSRGCRPTGTGCARRACRPVPASGSGVMRKSSDSPLSSSAKPWARTVDSAQMPPTKPSIVPSARTSASAPGLALVGASASTTRACTNGTRAGRAARPPERSADRRA